MKLAMFGTGYVGLVTGTCFADLGNDVICVDIDQKKIDQLKKGIIPIYEPGLSDLVKRNVKAKRLNFTIDAAKAIKESEIIFICVGTPQGNTGKADLQYVLDVAKAIGEQMDDYKIIVTKSTVPVGTGDKVKRFIRNELYKRKSKLEFDVVSNPEFLKEGAAIKDFQNPDRVVIGVENGKAKKILENLYQPVARTNKPVVFMDVKSSELTKYAANAMLATRISLMNEIAALCEEVGADIKQVAKGIGLDSRIGSRFLSAGAGYGGSCFPKDVKALIQTLENHGFNTSILRAVDYVNERQKKSIVPKLKRFLPDLEGKKIALWGLSFKPKTDDMREAPSLTIVDQLSEEYATVSCYDPEAMENAKVMFAKHKNTEFCGNSYDCLKDADALIIITEWDEFRSPDFKRMKELMQKHIIIDGRNIYDPEEIARQGFSYAGVGK